MANVNEETRLREELEAASSGFRIKTATLEGALERANDQAASYRDALKLADDREKYLRARATAAESALAFANTERERLTRELRAHFKMRSAAESALAEARGALRDDHAARAALDDYVWRSCTHNQGRGHDSWVICRECVLAYLRAALARAGEQEAGACAEGEKAVQGEPASSGQDAWCPTCHAPLAYLDGEWRPHPLQSLTGEQLAHHHKPITEAEIRAALEQGERDREALERATPRRPGTFTATPPPGEQGKGGLSDRAIRCVGCGKAGRRRWMHPAREGWLYIEVRDDEDGDSVIEWACSRACADAQWKAGPGERLDAQQEQGKGADALEWSSLDIVFDGPPGHESGRFVECEDANGQSVKAGEWIDRGNGLWALRIAVWGKIAPPEQGKGGGEGLEADEDPPRSVGDEMCRASLAALGLLGLWPRAAEVPATMVAHTTERLKLAMAAYLSAPAQPAEHPAKEKA